MTTLLWFRDDLRLADHQALTAAAAHGPIVAVYIHNTHGERPLGAAARWWLTHSLTALRASLAAKGVPLVVRAGDPQELLPALAAAVGAQRVAFQERYHFPASHHDAVLTRTLTAQGLTVEAHPGHLLFHPDEVRTGQGGRYRVYTPFARRCEELGISGRPLPVPPLEGAPCPLEEGDIATALDCPDTHSHLAAHWQPGHEHAAAQLDWALDRLDGYAEGRDHPAAEHTTRLSPRIRFGELSARQVYLAGAAVGGTDAGVFLREILWREFAWHRLVEHPDLATEAVREQFHHFPWDPATSGAAQQALHDWQEGQTGQDLVDAGMRELATTGFMHNRVRMVVGSYLTKNLLIHWRRGEEWFWEHLVDADPASNPFNWQWVAGCGDDAAPYFRIFNPATQATRFDPQGRYRRRFLPEGLRPAPLVDLRDSRQAALEAYQSVR